MLDDVYIECPACGRSIKVRPSDVYFFEARFRTRGKAKTPAPRGSDDPALLGRCGVCDGPVQQRHRTGGRDIASVGSDDEADYPAPRRAPDRGGPPSAAAKLLGLGLGASLGFLAAGFVGIVLFLGVGIVRSRGGRPHVPPPPGPRRSATQFPGLLGCWALDESDGARAADSSGNAGDAASGLPLNDLA